MSVDPSIAPIRRVQIIGANGAPSGSAASGYAASGKTPVAGAFTASGQSSSFTPLAGRPLNVSLSGTFSANVVPERSFDAGSTWLPLTYIDGSAISWSAPMSTDLTENETGVLYRLNCTWTSGTVTYRLSQ